MSPHDALNTTESGRLPGIAQLHRRRNSTRSGITGTRTDTHIERWWWCDSRHYHLPLRSDVQQVDTAEKIRAGIHRLSVRDFKQPGQSIIWTAVKSAPLSATLVKEIIPLLARQLVGYIDKYINEFHNKDVIRENKYVLKATGEEVQQQAIMKGPVNRRPKWTGRIHSITYEYSCDCRQLRRWWHGKTISSPNHLRLPIAPVNILWTIGLGPNMTQILKELLSVI